MTNPSTLPNASAGTILVVEDDVQMQLLIMRVLVEAGYRVHLADEGAKALATLAEHGDTLRAVYLDLALPDMRGEDVLARMRALRPSLPVVLCSGDSPRDPLTTPFLSKPFHPRDLRDAIGRAVEASAAPVDDDTFALTLRLSRADLDAIDCATESLRASLLDTSPRAAAEITRESVAVTLMHVGLRRHTIASPFAASRDPQRSS